MALTIKQNKRRYKAKVIVTAGTPIFLTDDPTLQASSVFVQMKDTVNGVGYVYDDVADLTGVQIAAGGDIPITLRTGENVPFQGGSHGSLFLRDFAFDGDTDGIEFLVDCLLKI